MESLNTMNIILNQSASIVLVKIDKLFNNFKGRIVTKINRIKMIGFPLDISELLMLTGQIFP
jgi:hypothetical protein